VPVTEPLVGGVKVTLIVQLLLAATLVPQLLVSPKLLDPAVMPMLVIESALDAALLRVTGSEVVEVVNERLPGETETLVPVPLKLTVCGLPLALSVIDRVPATALVEVAANVTLTVQLAPAEMPLLQVLVST
jgi:hypothetical protein